MGHETVNLQTSFGGLRSLRFVYRVYGGSTREPGTEAGRISGWIQMIRFSSALPKIVSESFASSSFWLNCPWNEKELHPKGVKTPVRRQRPRKFVHGSPRQLFPELFPDEPLGNRKAPREGLFEPKTWWTV